MPESNIHKGDDELGGCQDHSHYHNVLLRDPSLVFLSRYNLLYYPYTLLDELMSFCCQHALKIISGHG